MILRRLEQHCIIIRRDYNTYNELFFSGVDGELITIRHLSYENIWDLINEVEVFVNNELA